MVQRYNYCEGDEDMCEDTHGAYVSYHDYADLEAENARLREALWECVRMLGGESDYDEPLCITKAREVLGDAALR